MSSEAVMLDLMCGSGAIAGASSLFWPTYVSDAMSFCRILARVQGGGLNIERANRLISKIQANAADNMATLKDIFSNELAIEDRIFHSEINSDLKEEYGDFCLNFPVINQPNSKAHNIYYATTKKYNCLFTCAYSNLYLGVRQSAEIDSYRSAIEHLDGDDKIWALGALIATVSAVGNTYGGHFAQPKYKDIDLLSKNELFKLIERRSISIGSEFAVRLREFALESQTSNSYKIESLDGPWEKALNLFQNIDANNGIVYLDAPYTRDEYSRYYHLLETLVNYNYPKIGGVGRVPDKKSGGRFSSDFFTRVPNKLKDVYVNIITAIIDKGYVCAWSYSDNATISCAEIIYEVSSQHNCNIASYATPYLHQGQGGQRAKKIKEYLIIFTPVGISI